MKRILLPLLMGLFIFWACGGGDVTPENPEPTPQPEQKEPLVIPSTENLSPTFDVAGGSSTVSFTANADWVATVTNTRADAWCTVSPSSGTKGNNTITIKVASNDTPDSRSAVVQLVSGTAARNINVTQKQKDALTLTTDRFEISKEGGLVEIEVKANVQVSYSIDDKSKDWVSYVGTRALKSSIMTFKVLENGTSEKRESTITLSSGSLKETVTIYQSAGEKPSIVISKNEYNISSEGETIQVEVSSNVDVEVVMPGVEWLTENTTRAMSTHTYYYTVSSNEGYDSRSAEIIFRNKANNLEEKVTVNQAQKDAIIIAGSEYYFGYERGFLDFEVAANVDYNVTIDCDWIRQITTRGLSTTTLKFDIDENTGTETRSGIITVSSGSISQKVKVIQEAEFSISIDTVEVGPQKSKFEVTVRSSIGYKVESAADWIKEVSVNGIRIYTHTFEVSENSSSSPREGVIVFCNDKQVCIPVVVKQRGTEAYITIEEKEYTIGSDGGDVNVEVSSNVEVEVVMPGVDWLTINEAKSRATGKYYFSVSPNEEYDSRSAEIIFRNKANNIEEKVTVCQVQKDAIIIAGSEYYFGYERGFLDFEVASNVDYNVTIDCDWIRQVTTRGLSTTTLNFDIDENTGTEDRTGTITVSSGSISQKVKVIQSCKEVEFSISTGTVELGPEKSKFEVIVTSNIGYKVEPAVDWIKEVSVEGTGVYKHTFEVSENSSSAPREGVIVFCNDNQVCIPVVVKQRGAEAYITIEEKEYTIGSDGGDVNVEVSSNVEVEVVMPGVDWLTINEAKSRATGNYYFSVLPNESIEIRSAEVIFRNEENQIWVAIRINQLGKDEFSISTDKVELGAEEGFFEFVVRSSIGYNVEPAADWINEISKTGSNGVYTHTFKVGANTSTEAREGVVVVCNDNQVCIPVVVRQAGAQTQDEEDMSWVDKEFYHRSLAMRFTADWCGYCPTVAANMAEFERLYPNKVEMVHMHCDGNLKFSGAGPLENLCNITGFPTGIFDMRGEFYSTSSIKEQLDKTEQNYSTQTGVSYKSSLSGSNLTLDLKVYAKEADKYKITVLLLEDNIVGYQADYYNGTQYDYVHSGVVRMALTNVLGDDCTTTQNNQIVKKSYSINIPSKYKKENMRILVYVQRPYGGQSIIDGKYYGNYYVDNSISGKLGAEFKLEMIEDLSGGGNEDIIPDDDIDF